MKVVERQTATANGHGGRRSRAYGFTEHGVAMFSSVLRSDQAIRVNIEIMRSFVRLRRRVGEIAEFAARLEEPEQRYDARFKQVFDAIRALMAPTPGDRRPIGF